MQRKLVNQLFEHEIGLGEINKYLSPNLVYRPMTPAQKQFFDSSPNITGLPWYSPSAKSRPVRIVPAKRSLAEIKFRNGASVVVPAFLESDLKRFLNDNPPKYISWRKM